jgi:hypothetical protein
MKHSLKWMVLCLVLVAFFSGCGGGGKFSGVWTARTYDTDVALAFIDDLCFLVIGRNDIKYSTYTFLKNEGILVTDLGNIPVLLKGNSLTLTYDGTTIVFVKDTKAKEAPASINGIWRGPTPWLFAFVNEKVFIIDEDEDLDYGTYTFADNSGSFETEIYDWEMEFTVKGNTLTTSDDLTAAFTRTK